MYTINLLFQVEKDPSEFGLCVIYDCGFKEPCKEDAYPLHQRLKLGPNEDIAKVYIMEASECQDIEVSSEVCHFAAQGHDQKFLGGGSIYM